MDCAVCINFFVTFFALPFIGLSLVGLDLVVPEMTYNVSSGS